MSEFLQAVKGGGLNSDDFTQEPGCTTGTSPLRRQLKARILGQFQAYLDRGVGDDRDVTGFRIGHVEAALDGGDNYLANR